MRYLLKINLPVFFTIVMILSCARMYGQAAHKKNIYSNVPSLEEVSGIWLNGDTMAMEPSIRNFRGTALLNRDMTSISWFASAPFSGGYHSGIMRVNGEVPRARMFRWFPWQALRKMAAPTYKITTNTRMLPDQNVVMWEVTITNPSKIVQHYNVDQDLIGFISNYSKEQWPWPYPYPTLKGKTSERNDEIVNVIKHIGVKQKDFKVYKAEGNNPSFDSTKKANSVWPSDEQILASSKYSVAEHDKSGFVVSDSETLCFAGFKLVDAPDRLSLQNSGGTAYWSFNLKPGESRKIRFIMAYGLTKGDVIANLNQYSNRFNQTFAGIEATWKSRWAAMFRPGNAIFSGNFPVLQTNDKAARKVYYTGPLTLLYLLNTNLPAHKRVYLTGGPRWGASVSFFWDTTCWSEILAVIDPDMLKEQLKTIVGVNISKYFAVDNYTGNGTGNGYVANYWAVFQLIRSYITLTKDYGFLNEEIKGKKLIDYLTDYAYHWKEISIYGQPGCTDDMYKLADFGGNPWNLLECVPTYIHIVPSFNIGYVWMMRETAKLDRNLGENAKADKLTTDADTMVKRVLKLYAGNGVWNSLYPGNKKVEVRHIMDFMYAGRYISDDMSPKMKKEMVDFADNELLTDHWMRAQSLKDISAKYSDRPDHGPLGAYDAWPDGIMDGFSQMGYTQKALNFYDAIAPVTYEGCWSQAHELWGPNKYNKKARVRIAERGWNNRDGIEGIEMSQVMMKDFFGFYPQIDGSSPIRDTKQSINFKGNLYNVLYGGKLYNLSTNNGKTSMRLMSE